AQAAGPVVDGADALVLGAERDPRSVARPGDRAGRGIGLEHDVAELLGGAGPALHVDWDFGRRVGRVRRLAERAARDLHVLRAQRANDLAGGQVAAGGAVGIDPHAHRVVA